MKNRATLEVLCDTEAGFVNVMGSCDCDAELGFTSDMMGGCTCDNTTDW